MEQTLGLCVCYSVKNYGSVLQSYATALVLEDLHIPYEIIRYKKRISLGYIFKSLPFVINGVFFDSFRAIVRKKAALRRSLVFAENSAIRNKAFDRFIRERFIQVSPLCSGYSVLKQYAKKYTVLMVGSDQVWRPTGVATDFYNLLFAGTGFNKIAYASSFGVRNIPFIQRWKTVNFLKQFNWLSVREEQGRKIIKDLTGQEAAVVLDPVLLLKAERWEEVIPGSQPYAGSYIFTYFLGNTLEYRAVVRRLSEDTGLKIVTLRHLDEYTADDEMFGDYAPYDIDPAGFVNLIRKADYVCTDSFHGTAFSIINHKRFMAFNRYVKDTAASTNSRMDTLLGSLGLADRRYNGKSDIKEAIMQHIDYDAVDLKRETLRDLSMRFLNQALASIQNV